MNEIEQHVMTINVMQSAYRHIRHSDAEFLALEAAKEALREQAERSKGCVSCDGGFGDNTVEFKKLGYTTCPYCGKRLEVEHGE